MKTVTRINNKYKYTLFTIFKNIMIENKLSTTCYRYKVINRSNKINIPFFRI